MTHAEDLAVWREELVDLVEEMQANPDAWMEMQARDLAFLFSLVLLEDVDLLRQVHVRWRR